MKKEQWAISDNGEIFYGGYETREQAIKEGKTIYKDKFWIGQREPKYLSSFIDIEDLLEQAWCRADDEVGEVSEDFLHIKKEEKEELEKIIVDYLDKKGYSPTFFGIINSEKIEIKND